MAQSGTDSSGEARGGPLDALRFLAAVFIVTYHYMERAPVQLDRWIPALDRGWLATDFFLMMSGFVLGRAYGAALDKGQVGPVSFFARRLVRVWPSHLICLAALVLLVVACRLTGLTIHHPDRFQTGDLITQAALIHGWGFAAHPTWNMPSWTVSVLLIGYAAFPFAWRAVKGLEGRPAALFVALDILALAALGSRLLLGHAPWDATIESALLRAVPLFLCGLVLSRASNHVGLKPREGLALTGGALAALFLFQSGPRHDITDLASMVCIAFVILASGSVAGPRHELAAKAVGVSFALFITHTLAGAVWFGGVQALETQYVLAEPLRWALWLGAFAFALTVAWAFDRWVDAPIQARLRIAMRPKRVDSPVEA